MVDSWESPLFRHMALESPTRSGFAGRPRIGIAWKEQSSHDIDAARALIDRTHYQDGKVDGEFLISFAELDEVGAIVPEFVPSWTSDDLCLIGVAVVKRGMTHGNPSGRQDLAAKKFPGLKLERLSRDEVVRQMGLALISRVAVEPDLQGYGIGRALAKECRRQAASLVPGSRYVEVMTSQRLSDAQRLLKKENARRDFLQAAGFRLAPNFTKIQRPRRDGRNRRLYYWASVIQ
jgi:GNAT superfamily N-acetyltransferase